MAQQKPSEKVLATNRQAHHLYFIETVYEAGLELVGTEVKSIRAGQANLKESYCFIKDGEIFVSGMHVSPYDHGNIFNVNPLRDRRLLMHKREIRKLAQEVKLQGVTLVPLRLYLVKGRVKLELAVAKGKKLYDKRDEEAKRSAQRDIDRAVRDRY